MEYTKGECPHSFIFNDANDKSECVECGTRFLTTKLGQRLNLDALEDMYEALEITLKNLADGYANENLSLKTMIREALAKARGE